jgi:hypothetical protein
MHKQKINNISVKPIAIPKDKRPIKGADFFDKAYMTCYMLGKKNSGKTSNLWNIIANRIESNTTVVVFCATLHADPSWIAIIKALRKKGVPLMLYTAIVEDGVNNLQELLSELNDQAAERDAEEKEPKKKKKPVAAIKTEDDEDEEEKVKKPKYLAADWLIIFDDMSDQIKNGILEKFIKLHRHHRSAIFISNQTLNDLSVASRKNIDFWILYTDIDGKKLSEIYNKCSLGITFEKFSELYHDATSKPYSFFFNANKADYRQNFNARYLTKHSDSNNEKLNQIKK